MIRRMQEKDLPYAAKLEAEYFSVPWSLGQLTESLKDPGYLFLAAEEDGRVVGYAGLLKVLEEGDITNIVVEEAYRGRGIGKLLTRRLMEEGRAFGLTAFTLEVRVGNAAAIHVYESLGFRAEGVRRRFYERPAEDALIMWKREGEAPESPLEDGPAISYSFGEKETI